MAVLTDVVYVLLVTTALADIAAFAQESNHAKDSIQIPHRQMPELSHTKYVNVGNIPNIDYGKLDAALLQKLAKLEKVPLESASKYGDIRDWLIVKAREAKEGIVKGANNGFDTTPVGNISQQCYTDMLRFASDAESLQPYASKMSSAWGDPTTWFKAIHTGNAKSYGVYELCVGINKEDGLPFDSTQYCALQYPIVEIFGINAVIGTCWPSSCSTEDLMTAHWNFIGEGEDPFAPSYVYYDCSEDHPWDTGAIITLSLLSFFALLVVVGSVYHVISHDHVTSVLESLKQASTKSKAEKAEENVYEQVVNDEDQKDAMTHTTAIDEKCVRVRERDDAVKEEPVTIGNGVGNGHAQKSKSKTKANEITKLMIEDDGPKISEFGGHKLARMDQLLMSFSVFQNTEKIFSTRSSSSLLGALNGIRVLSLLWVILGHSVISPLGVRYDNAGHLLDVSGSTAMLAVVNGTYSVDTFFVLSGFLVTYLTLKELAKTNGRINWFMFYFHRFWRLTPLYMLCIGIYTSLTIHMGKGPLKDDYWIFSGDVCRDYWWANLLYIQNLYPFPGNLGTTQCLGWSWYLANDMQFFLISPVIIYLLYKYWKWGVSLIALLTAVSFGSTAGIVWYWGLGVGGTGLYNNRTETTEGINSDDDFIYTKPWCRIQSYLVGMMLAYIIYKLKGRPLKLNKFVLLAGWLVSTALACTVIYGLQATYNGQQTPQWLAVAYNATSRFVFSLSVAWVMFVCITGNGGYINSFLAWTAWAPLAKLNFAAYLVHLIIMSLVLTTMKTTLHWSWIEMCYWFFANVVATYLCAYVLSLLVEGPTVGIEKVLIGRPSRAPEKKDK